MNNYCAYSKTHQCIKWNDYQITRSQLEEADELCHMNWVEIESLQRRIVLLESILEEKNIPIPVFEED